MGKEDVAQYQRNCNRSLSQNGDRIAGQACWGSDPERAKKSWPLSQRRALELVLWTAEGVTWGTLANTSPNNGAHLDITSSFFSLHFPEERGGRRGGAPNGKHVCSTFQLQLPACLLPDPLLTCPPACVHVQPCPWCCYLWPSHTPNFAPWA